MSKIQPLGARCSNRIYSKKENRFRLCKTKVERQGHLCEECWWNELKDIISNNSPIHVAHQDGHYWIDPIEIFFERHGKHPDR